MTRILSFLLFLAAMCPAMAQTYIHAGKLIDGKSDTVRGKVTVIVEDNRIKSVQDGFQKAPTGATTIDLKDKTLMPGLMDMHTHLTTSMSPSSYTEGFRMDPQDYAYRAGYYAEITLMAGFTTIREVGSRYFMDVSLKKAIAAGYVKGPRIFGAGTSIATTGGHADRTNGRNTELMGDPGPNDGVVNSVEDARKAVRYRYKRGADLIKITATGGVLSLAKNGQNPQFMDDELKAIVDTATDYGMMVAAHAHGTDGIKRAVRAGVTTIEHGTYLDDEAMAMMIEKGTYLVPTLMAGWHVSKPDVNEMFPPVVRGKAATIGPVMLENFGKVYKRGVKIAFGTDSGVSPHGDNAQEFVLMVDGGMKPMDAIKSATSVTATLLDMTDDLGSVEAGKLADLVAVNDNPIVNIKTMLDVRFVMKDGVVYKNLK